MARLKLLEKLEKINKLNIMKTKGMKKLEKLISYIDVDGRPEKEISSEVKKELLDALTFVIENRTMSK